MVLAVKKTSQFKSDLKLAYRQRRPLDELEDTMNMIVNEQVLPAHYRDHPLVGNWKGSRECHINGYGDWLLIYSLKPGEVIFERVGTHSELF
ncbi:MAG: type II toxin-antitoxin system YafQ family toxin [Candidatus Berkiella sp.]